MAVSLAEASVYPYPMTSGSGGWWVSSSNPLLSDCRMKTEGQAVKEHLHLHLLPASAHVLVMCTLGHLRHTGCALAGCYRTLEPRCCCCLLLFLLQCIENLKEISRYPFFLFFLPRTPPVHNFHCRGNFSVNIWSCYFFFLQYKQCTMHHVWHRDHHAGFTHAGVVCKISHDMHGAAATARFHMRAPIFTCSRRLKVKSIPHQPYVNT